MGTVGPTKVDPSTLSEEVTFTVEEETYTLSVAELETAAASNDSETAEAFGTLDTSLYIARDDELDITELRGLLSDTIGDEAKVDVVINSVFSGTDPELWISTVHSKLDGGVFGADSTDAGVAGDENGEQTFYDANGNPVDAAGNLLESDGTLQEDSEGNPIPGEGVEDGNLYDSDGNLVDGNGYLLNEDGSQQTDAAGDPILGAGMQDPTEVAGDENGEQTFYDASGNPVDAAGNLLESDGTLQEDSEGNPIPGEGVEDGNLYDSDGNLVDGNGYLLNEDGSQQTDAAGDPILGAGMQDPTEVAGDTPPENAAGELVDDMGRRVDAEGYLIDSSGDRLEDSNGDPILGAGYSEPGVYGSENPTPAAADEIIEGVSSGETYETILPVDATTVPTILGDDDGVGVSTVGGRAAIQEADETLNGYDDDAVRLLTTTADVSAYIIAELPATLATGDEDLTVPTGDTLLAENQVAMERLANWVALRSDGTDADQGAADAIAIINKMAEMGLTVDQVISYFDGGAIDPDAAETGTSAMYTGAGDGTISDDEMTFALQDFKEKHDVGAAVGTPMAIPLENGSELLPGDGAMLMSGAEQANLTTLKDSATEGEYYHIDDIELFLDAAKQSTIPETYSSAIVELLNLLGVRSEDGARLDPSQNIVQEFADKEPNDIALLLAQPSYSATGVMEAGTTVTPASAMSAIRNDDTLRPGDAYATFAVEVPNSDTTMDATTYHIPPSIGEGSNGNMAVTPTEFYSAIGDAASTDTAAITVDAQTVMSDLDENTIGAIAAITSVIAGVSAADVKAVIDQMSLEGMTVGELFMTMNGGRITGSFATQDGVGVDYNGQGAVAEADGITADSGRWGLADYAASRDDIAVHFDGGTASIPDATELPIGGTYTGTTDLVPGDGQEVVPTDMMTPYQAVSDPLAPTATEIQAIYDTAETEHDQMTALALVLDLLGFERANGMPLQINDPLVTALHTDIGGATSDSAVLMNYLATGDSTDTSVAAADILLTDMVGNVQTLLDTTTDSAASSSTSSGTNTDIVDANNGANDGADATSAINITVEASALTEEELADLFMDFDGGLYNDVPYIWIADSEGKEYQVFDNDNWQNYAIYEGEYDSETNDVPAFAIQKDGEPITDISDASGDHFGFVTDGTTNYFATVTGTMHEVNTDGSVNQTAATGVTFGGGNTDTFIDNFGVDGTYTSRADAYNDFAGHILLGHTIEGQGLTNSPDGTDDNPPLDTLGPRKKGRLAYFLEHSLGITSAEANTYIDNFAAQGMWLGGIFDLLDGQTWNGTTATADADAATPDEDGVLFEDTTGIVSVFDEA